MRCSVMLDWGIRPFTWRAGPCTVRTISALSTFTCGQSAGSGAASAAGAALAADAKAAGAVTSIAAATRAPRTRERFCMGETFLSDLSDEVRRSIARPPLDRDGGVPHIV